MGIKNFLQQMELFNALEIKYMFELAKPKDYFFNS